MRKPCQKIFVVILPSVIAALQLRGPCIPIFPEHMAIAVM